MTVRTSCLCVALASLLSVATSPAFALDMIGEEFGNAPFRATNLPAGQLALLNDARRVYLYHVASDGYKSFISGYYQGDTAAANDFLRRYAALEKDLEVVLLPGPREVASFHGKRTVSADWELHVPSPHQGRRQPGRAPLFALKPTLYLYVRVPDRPANVARAEQVARWLAALDAEDSKSRAAASRPLENQGVAVTASLRKAREGTPAAETRRRIDALLGKLEAVPGVNLGVLTIPDDLSVVGRDDLMARNRAQLKGENVRAKGEVAELMRRFGPDPEALATVIEMLDAQEAYPRQLAIRELGRMGKSAASALPALKARLDDPVPYIRSDSKDAIAAIEAGPEAPDAVVRAEKARAVREEIGRFMKARGGNAN